MLSEQGVWEGSRGPQNQATEHTARGGRGPPALAPSLHPHHSVPVVLLYKGGTCRGLCAVDAKAQCSCHAETCRGMDHPILEYTPCRPRRNT